MYNMTPVTDEEQKSLEEVCQQNGWLKRGGYDWQDDPYLEEYPYEFDRAHSLDDLQEFFCTGNWAIRQGVLYGDLAFIQQMSGGDEWWTLKQTPNKNWVPFESINFGRIAKDRSELVRHLTGMRLATPDECKRLEYMIPESDLTWRGNAFPYLDDGEAIGETRDFQIQVRATYMGHLLSVSAPDENLMADQAKDGATLLDVIKDQVRIIKDYEREGDKVPLADRAQGAILASERQQGAERTSEPIQQNR